MESSKDKTITLHPADIDGIDPDGEAITLPLRRNPEWKEPDLATILGWKRHSDFNEDVALDTDFALSRYDEDHSLGKLMIEVSYRDGDRKGSSSQCAIRLQPALMPYLMLSTPPSA